MIEGRVTSDLAPALKLTLVGVGPREVDIDADVDTCFTGDISLPIERILNLGWPFWDEDFVTLGDGRDIKMKFYRGIVMWRGQPKIVKVLASESTPLLGRRLVEGNEVNIQFKRGGSVSISPLS